MVEIHAVSPVSYTKIRSFFFNLQTSTLSKERENSLPSHLKGTVRRTQADITGNAQGGGDATGATTSTGSTFDSGVFGFTTSAANGNFAFESGGSGFVDIKDAGVQASGVARISGTSLGKVDGTYSGYGDTSFTGSSTASGDGNGVGGFSPSGATGSGSGTGILNVTGSAFFKRDRTNPYSTGFAVGGGTAKTAAEGSATAFNMMASAGGIGSGMSTGSASAVLNAVSTYGVEIDSAATGTFNGIGSGSYGNALSQPYSNGFVNGYGGGGGTAVVNGDLTGFTTYYGQLTNLNADAAFTSTGSGSGFVRGINGGADGSASGGASGNVTGLIMSDLLTSKTFGDLDFSATSAANGLGAFLGGFSISELPGPTGGTGLADGTLNLIAQSGSGKFNIGLVSSSGSGGSFGGGEASGFNVYGEAGGLASGSTAGSAISGITLYDSAGEGTGTSMSNFDGTGSGVFANPINPPTDAGVFTIPINPPTFP
jgi:hypothetical protein